MNELFGISMTTIMVALLAALGVCVLAVAAIALVNPMMVRLGLRNIPRRRAQSVLVVLGLMLSTLIITAAFTVGDSLDYSITRDVYDIYRPWRSASPVTWTSTASSRPLPSACRCSTPRRGRASRA
jgi:hypothetical protein